MSTFRLKLNDAEYKIPVECPHRKGWLSRGRINRTRHGKCFLVCPLHYSTFELPTGRQVSGPSAQDLSVMELGSTACSVPEMEITDAAAARDF